MPKLKSNPIRIETGNTKGWQVRFYYREGGKTRYHSKLFSDGLHGGKRTAYRAAIAYRDAHHEAFLNAYRSYEIEPYRRRDRRNNSGVPGIMFYEHEGTSGPLVHVRAHVPGTGGRLRTKTLSLAKHGAEMAVKEACKFRYKGLRKLHGASTPYASWQRLYNAIVEAVGERYGLQPVEEPEMEAEYT